MAEGHCGIATFALMTALVSEVIERAQFAGENRRAKDSALNVDLMDLFVGFETCNIKEGDFP